MAIQKKSLITNLSASKKAVVASNKKSKVASSPATVSPSRLALSAHGKTLSPNSRSKILSPSGHGGRISARGARLSPVTR